MTTPGKPQNFQSRLPLVGYESNSSCLNTFWLSGLIFDEAITLPDQMGLQPGRAWYFQPDSFSNAIVIMSDQSRAREFLSADTAIVSCSYYVGF
jgi:hypothetical protein